jgi:hypothetical protein
MPMTVVRDIDPIRILVPPSRNQTVVRADRLTRPCRRGSPVDVNGIGPRGLAPILHHEMIEGLNQAYPLSRSPIPVAEVGTWGDPVEPLQVWLQRLSRTQK